MTGDFGIPLLRIALCVAMKTMQFHIHITKMCLILGNIVFCIKVGHTERIATLNILS